MKKGTALMVLAAAAGLASCGQSGTPKANMKSDVDTLSYMVGVSNSQGLKDYVVGRLGVDTTYMADFVRGIKEGMKNTSAKEKAYMAGMQIGQQVSGDMYEAINNQLFAGDSTTTMSKENFLAGFIAAVEENSLVTADSASVYVRTKSEEIKTKALEAKYGEYKKENEEFLSKDGIKVTESGLQYRIIKEGKGEIPTKTSRVKVHYKGTMIDGTEFDSSYERKEPTTFRADQVIKGWTEALTMMPVGSKWELYIPQELGYGSREAGKIKPFSTLIFEVELISIEK